MYVPADPPERCPACGAPYESVSRHAGGFAVNLLDNERYRRVCFHPATAGDGDLDADGEAGDVDPALDCYHHTHHQVGDSPDGTTSSEGRDGTTSSEGRDGTTSSEGRDGTTGSISSPNDGD